MVCENSRNREANWDTRNHLSASVGHGSSSLYSETLIPREKQRKKRERKEERKSERERERKIERVREKEHNEERARERESK